ncbi:hypothetical protein L1887_28831 [Cichorium endivia]|nr:hypothetical protein L1887_28831 [Cichorium endivia]
MTPLLLRSSSTRDKKRRECTQYSSSDGEDEEEEGVSDTWEVEGHEDDMEEGEIGHYGERDGQDDVNMEGNDIYRSPEKLGVEASGENPNSQQQTSKRDQDPLPVIEKPTIIMGSPTEGHAAEDGNAQKDARDNNMFGNNGLFDGLVKSGCFGPFNSPINKLDKGPSESFFENGESVGKRRRLDRPIRSSQQLETLPRINLNNNFFEQQSESSTDGVSSSDMEAKRTVEVGRQVGFDIDEGDPILREALGEFGDNQLPQ